MNGYIEATPDWKEKRYEDKTKFSQSCIWLWRTQTAKSFNLILSELG